MGTEVEAARSKELWELSDAIDVAWGKVDAILAREEPGYGDEPPSPLRRIWLSLATHSLTTTVLAQDAAKQERQSQ